LKIGCQSSAQRVSNEKLVREEAPDPDLAINSRIGVASPILNPAETWNLENPAWELNSLTAKSVLAGTKNYPSVDLLRRNRTFFLVSTTHKQHHHGELPPPPSHPEFDYIF
jgi:hypothetical protein